MSFKRVLLLSAIVVALLAGVYGCFFGTSVEGRLDQLIGDLNSALRNLAYLNLDPSLSDYNALRTNTYWDNWFPLIGTGTPYSLHDIVINYPGTGLATVTALIDGPGGFGSDLMMAFDLVLVDFDWMISSITFDGDQLVPLPPPD